LLLDVGYSLLGLYHGWQNRLAIKEPGNAGLSVIFQALEPAEPGPAGFFHALERWAEKRPIIGKNRVKRSKPWNFLPLAAA
jgi:hypothetical protein